MLVFLLVSGGLMAQQKSAKSAKPAEKPFVVVIDAGHGGHDPGAVGKLVQEKTLNLTVSCRLADQIKKAYPDVKVLLTRSTDVFLTLQQRADFVNKNNADLFICIHTNSAENKSVSGAETFVLGVDKMESNLSVAMRENAVMLLEDDYQTAYEGFDPNSVDSYIMFELMQDQYFDKSLSFATLVQQEFTGLKRADRGVRQAGFWVLHKSACPSVLVEMGFISNREEEKYLHSEQGRQEITNAIFNAFVAFKADHDKRHGKVSPVVPRAEYAKPQEAKPDTTTEAAAEQKATEQKATKTESAKADVPAAKAESVKVEHAAVLTYRVQIFSTKAPLKKGDPTFKGLKNCQYTKAGNFYKYTYGEDSDYETIVDIQKELKNKFKDCFIVAFLNGKQISVKEARAMK